jgi:hypothetical protein
MEDGSMRRVLVLILFISIMTLGVTSMEALGFLGIGNTAKWKEEVLLHDGRKIVVERWQKHGGRGEIGQSPIKEHTLTFTLPGTKRVITWKDEYSDDVGHSNFDLVALHIMHSTPYIITTAYGCLAYNKWGRPNPPYIIFKYEGTTWRRLQLKDLPSEFNNVNLVINTSAHEEELASKKLVSAEKVKALNSSLTQEEYKRIIRTSINPRLLQQGCPVLERRKDGWYSPGGAKAPQPIAPKISENTK